MVMGLIYRRRMYPLRIARAWVGVRAKMGGPRLDPGPY